MTRAQAYFDAGKELEALRLLDVAKAVGSETTSALGLRLAIFRMMLKRSVETHDNMSESGILRAKVGQIEKALEAVPR